MGKKILRILGILVVVVGAFLVWYRSQYSMREVVGYEMTPQGTTGAVLIATQGSAYKDSVVKYMVRDLVDMDVHVLVLDVKELKTVDVQQWDAIVLLHTWEYMKAQPDAADFIARNGGMEKIVVLSTSGSGEEKLTSVDGISSASVITDAHKDAATVLDRVKALLPQ